jgi:hypothetical protein
MGTRQACAATTSASREIEITDAAIGAYARLLATVGARLRTHGCHDGGLLCEDRRNRARPTIWRISPEGAVLPDTRYDYRLRAFVAGAVPAAA